MDRDALEVTCFLCGTYWIDGFETIEVQNEPVLSKRWILSALSINANALKQTLFIEKGSARRLVEGAPLPRSLLEVMDRVLEWLAAVHRADGTFAGTNRLEVWAYLLFYLPQATELRYVLNAMAKAGWIAEPKDVTTGGWAFEITPEGWDRASKLRSDLRRLDQAFVAIWFDKQMDPAYQAIERACNAAGYHALKISLEEHNDSIMDRVVAAIRRSMFVIADLTDHRNGVYFEGGFAKGLGLEVIWTCRASDFERRHFDIRHLNTIRWATADELEAALLARIRATAPLRQPISKEGSLLEQVTSAALQHQRADFNG